MKTPRRKFTFIFLTIIFSVIFSACQSSAPKVSEKINAPAGMVFIKGGSFEMGDRGGMPFEAPVHTVELDSFFIDSTEVTVAEFAKFIEATGYRTEAENFGWSAVFDFETGAWKRADGADWRHPEGKNSTAAPDEP